MMTVDKLREFLAPLDGTMEIAVMLRKADAQDDWDMELCSITSTDISALDVVLLFTDGYADPAPAN
jgi:hypothetical protein